MSWFFAPKEAPKPSRPPVGKDLQPAQVKRGSLEHIVLSCIIEKIQEDPGDDDLEGISKFAQELDAIVDSGREVNHFYVSRCITMAKKVAADSEARLLAESGSRSSQSDARSSTSHRSSHGSDTSSTFNIDTSREPTKFDLATRATATGPSRLRPVLVRHRVGKGKTSFLSRRVARDSGIFDPPNEIVFVNLTFEDQTLPCELVINDDMEFDLVLAAEVAAQFRSYKPEDRMLDYFRNSTNDYASAQKPHSIAGGSSMGGRRQPQLDHEDNDEYVRNLGTILWAAGEYKRVQQNKYEDGLRD